MKRIHAIAFIPAALFSAIYGLPKWMSADACGTPLLSATTNTQTPASWAICGNTVKRPRPPDATCGSITNGATPPGPSPGRNCSRSDPKCCLSKAQKTDGSNVSAVSAREQVEMRGWVTSIAQRECANSCRAGIDDCQGYGDCDNNMCGQGIGEEYRFDIAIDLDWDKSPCLPASVMTINSLDTLAASITAGNLESAQMATADGTPGGANIVVHVEVDGWFEGGRMGIAKFGPPPTDWHPAARSNALVGWPFDPDFPPTEALYANQGALAKGDYVRLVGTLWEDTHGESGCWAAQNVTSRRGWMELHPVDYMARINRKPRATHGNWDRSSWGVLALCGGASGSLWKITPPVAVPGPNAILAVDDPRVAPDFTAPATTRPNAAVVNNDHVEISASVPANGTLLSFFRVYWQPPPPPTPSVVLSAVCGNEVQITTDAPFVDANGQPLLIAFSRQIGSQPATLLTPFAASATRSLIDQAFINGPPPSATLTYGVCIKDSWQREACNTASINVANAHPTQLFCNGTCADLASDWRNCGACGVLCEPLVLGGVGTCVAGSCVCPSSATTVCSYGDTRVCTNLNTSSDSCGACGHHCINGSCSSGVCVCAAGLQVCPANDGADSICTNPATDPANCGRCGNACPSSSSCEGGVCGGCPVGWTRCSGTCTNTDYDNLNCGGCGHVCPSGRVCDGGACVRNPRN
jgi:hypothetical protein